MKQMIKDTIVLFVITILAGAMLGGVYFITKKPIAEQEALAKARAYQTVFADADRFEDEADFDSAHADLVLSNIDKEHDYSGSTVKMFSLAYSKDELLGFVVTMTSHEGFGGDISFSMGIRLDGTLNGISITEIKETAGLGMKAPEILVPQFSDKATDARFVVVKTGAVYASDIDAISGATITSKAITNAVNAGITYELYRLEQYMNGQALLSAGDQNGGGLDA